MDAPRLEQFFGPPSGCLACLDAQLARRTDANRLPEDYADSSAPVIADAISSSLASRAALKRFSIEFGATSLTVPMDQYIFDCVLMDLASASDVTEPIMVTETIGGAQRRGGLAIHVPYGFSQEQYDAEIARVVRSIEAAIIEGAPDGGGNLKVSVRCSLADNVRIKAYVITVNVHHLVGSG